MRKQVPAELSAERKTPRKIDIRQPPGSPTPKASKQRRVVTDGQIPTKPKATTISTQSANLDGCPPNAAPDAPSQAPASSVLGKRRGANGANTTTNGNVSNPPSVVGGPVKSSNVNGIVQQLNGVHRSVSEGSQSQAGASDVPSRKAPPKLRKSQVDGA